MRALWWASPSARPTLRDRCVAFCRAGRAGPARPAEHGLRRCPSPTARPTRRSLRFVCSCVGRVEAARGGRGPPNRPTPPGGLRRINCAASGGKGFFRYRHHRSLRPAPARLPQQLGGLGPELKQLFVLRIVLLRPRDRLVEPLAGLKVIALPCSRDGLEEPVESVSTLAQVDRLATCSKRFAPVPRTVFG